MATVEKYRRGDQFKRQRERWQQRPRTRRDEATKSSEKQDNSGRVAPISIQLIVDKTTYKAGSCIRGTILLSVPQLATGCNDFSGLYLSLEGEETIEFQPAPEGYKENLFMMEKEVVRFRSPLVAGRYEYPLDWKMPEDPLPSSMSCGTDDVRWFSDGLSVHSKCEVRYTLKAYLAPTTTSKPNYATTICKQVVYIVPSGNNVNDSATSMDADTVVEKTFKMNSWLRKKGYIEFGVETNTVVASPISGLNVGITGRNQSSEPIKEFLIQLVETVEWGVERVRQHRSHRILADTIVPMNMLPPSWKEQNVGELKKKERGLPAPANSMSSEREAGRFTAQLQLRNGARDTYNGSMIRVLHTLEVTIVTKRKRCICPKIAIKMGVGQNHQPHESADQGMITRVHALDTKTDGDCYEENPSGFEIPETVVIHDDLTIGAGIKQNRCISKAVNTSSSLVWPPSSLNSTTSRKQMILEPILIMTVERD